MGTAMRALELESWTQRVARAVRPRYRALLRRHEEMLARLLRGVPSLLSGDARDWERALARALTLRVAPLMRDALADVASAGLATARPPASFADADDLPQPLRDWLADHLAGVWRVVAQQIARDVAQRVAQGLAAGETLDQLMAGVQTLLNGFPAYRLERIARTETTRVYNTALVYEGLNAPEVAGYRYSVVLDDRTSSVCRPLAGKVVDKYALRFIPPLHPNCRTVLVPLLAGDLQSALGAGQGLGYQDFAPSARAFGRLPQFLAELQASPERFWDLWRQHQHTIERYCFDIVGGREDDGKDLISDTMVRAYEQFTHYDATRASFSTWVWHIAVNLQRNKQRVRRREVLESDRLAE